MKYSKYLMVLILIKTSLGNPRTPVLYAPDNLEIHYSIPPRPICDVGSNAQYSKSIITFLKPIFGMHFPILSCQALNKKTACQKSFFGTITTWDEGHQIRDWESEDEEAIKDLLHLTMEEIIKEGVSQDFEKERESLTDCYWLTTNSKVAKIVSCHFSLSDSIHPGFLKGTSIEKSDKRGHVTIHFESRTIKECKFHPIGSMSCLTNLQKSRVVCPRAKRSLEISSHLCDMGSTPVYIGKNGELFSGTQSSRVKRSVTEIIPPFVRDYYQALFLTVTQNKTRSRRFAKTQISFHPDLGSSGLETLNFELEYTLVGNSQTLFFKNCLSIQEKWDAVINSPNIDCRNIYQLISGTNKILCTTHLGGYKGHVGIPIPIKESQKLYEDYLSKGLWNVTYNKKKFKVEPVSGLLIPEEMSLFYNNPPPHVLFFLKGYMKNGIFSDYESQDIITENQYVPADNISDIGDGIFSHASASWFSPLSTNLDQSAHVDFLNAVISDHGIINSLWHYVIHNDICIFILVMTGTILVLKIVLCIRGCFKSRDIAKYGKVGMF
uniref:Glycoprotein n=1 Tax=Coleopteran rhabdo-related virus OKIAV20 TaxID=2746287 RepID=A0A7D7F803_9RHAB|nr:glycoprotein [Coleopteran rhabdo-related virus OKIAV20]